MQSRWPLSSLCESDSFRWFAAYLLIHAADVQSAYNRRLEEYRNLHGIRNHAQPLPNLKTSNDWVETPLWIWHTRNPTRKAVWAREVGGVLLLGDGVADLGSVQRATNDPQGLVTFLRQLGEQGYRIRPKALANTLFLRIFLADFFFHGIGGAKYDQVTDLIFFDLFHTPPPAYGALSLTTWLPSKTPPLDAREIIHKRQQIREMHFHPEAFLAVEVTTNHQVSSQIKIKQKLLQTKPPRGSAGQWHRELEQVNERLRHHLQKKTDIEKKNLLSLLDRIQVTELFTSREWSFCLFEEQFLQSRLLDLNYAAT